MTDLTLRTLATLAVLMTAGVAQAREGMWLPEQLPERADELRSLGLSLDPEQLADPRGNYLGAVISLGGCSASFVSEDGLVVTNHHCAVGALQMNSTGENNLVTDGFHAPTRAEEVWAGPGSRVYITESLDDVTARVLAATADAEDDVARYGAVDRETKAIVAECEEQANRRCEVVDFYGGAEYRLIQKLEVEDVRIVYAPPESVGAFGGEVDNWMWPRHCGDFAFLRAYVGPDGNPAPYSEDNVPLRPQHYLRPTTGHLDPGDFVMVAGYPGRTNRWRTAREFAHAEEVSYPWQISTMNELMAIVEAQMERSEDVKVALSSYYFSLANYRKNNLGMLDGFRSSDTVTRRAATEAQATARLADSEAGEAFSRAQDELNAVFDDRYASWERETLLGWMRWSVKALGAANTGYWLAVERDKDDVDRLPSYQEREWPNLEERIQRINRSYDAEADELLFAYFLRRASQLPDTQRIEAFDALLRPYADEADPAAAAAADVYANTQMTDPDFRLALLSEGERDIATSGDRMLEVVVSLYPLQRADLDRSQQRDGALSRLLPAYTGGLREAFGSDVYPDANSTLRVTYGLVRGYPPTDGVWHSPFTTVDGIVAKHTGEEPFDAPDGLLHAIEADEQTRWHDPRLGAVPVDFLSTLDTTGGNSGSVTMNGRGEWVGLLFDGNYESMASDWLFDPAMTRSIHVDARYVLWYLDKVAGAQSLLRELGF